MLGGQFLDNYKGENKDETLKFKQAFHNLNILISKLRVPNIALEKIEDLSNHYESSFKSIGVEFLITEDKNSPFKINDLEKFNYALSKVDASISSQDKSDLVNFIDSDLRNSAKSLHYNNQFDDKVLYLGNHSQEINANLANVIGSDNLKNTSLFTYLNEFDTAFKNNYFKELSGVYTNGLLNKITPSVANGERYLEIHFKNTKLSGEKVVEKIKQNLDNKFKFLDKLKIEQAQIPLLKNAFENFNNTILVLIEANNLVKQPLVKYAFRNVLNDVMDLYLEKLKQLGENDPFYLELEKKLTQNREKLSQENLSEVMFFKDLMNEIAFNSNKNTVTAVDNNLMELKNKSEPLMNKFGLSVETLLLEENNFETNNLVRFSSRFLFNNPKKFAEEFLAIPDEDFSVEDYYALEELFQDVFNSEKDFYSNRTPNNITEELSEVAKDIFDKINRLWKSEDLRNGNIFIFLKNLNSSFKKGYFRELLIINGQNLLKQNNIQEDMFYKNNFAPSYEGNQEDRYNAELSIRHIQMELESNLNTLKEIEVKFKNERPIIDAYVNFYQKINVNLKTFNKIKNQEIKSQYKRILLDLMKDFDSKLVQFIRDKDVDYLELKSDLDFSIQNLEAVNI